MFMKWLTAGCNDRKRRLRGGAALLLPGLALTLLLSGCALAPLASDAELLELIEPPQMSKKPEFNVVKAAIETKVSATGKLMSEKQENLHFTSDNGQIAEIYVKAGDKVSKGQVIARVDTGNLETQIKRKDIEVRQAELSMIEKLREDNRTPIQKELDELNFELLKGELEELRAQLEASRLKAPFDGTLVSFAKSEGDTVRAYETIGVVADLDKLTVAVRFSSSDLESIVPGMDAVVDINTAGSHRGKVARLPLESGSSSGTDSLDEYVLIELDEFPEDVRSGTPLSASVITERKEDAILIPPAALRTVSGRNYVQVTDSEGNKWEVDVEVGLSTSTEVEIVKGLEPGQKVIGK